MEAVGQVVSEGVAQLNQISLLNDAKYFDEGTTHFSEMRQMLDSRLEKEKLEALKRLLALMTLGRDVSAFFPDVVKNVVVDNQEVKKLVYMYLVHYSEANPELALLSINSFHKDLASYNQKVRASALRAMSSIRVPVVVPLLLLSLKSAVKDTSSYVRRAAATALPKVLSLDPEQLDSLCDLVAELLTSPDPAVLSSACFAFQEVCPERFDLLHAHFRKICHLLADFDEWGQVVALGILTRYGRTQFLSPRRRVKRKGKKKKTKATKDRPFYSDDEFSDEEKESSAEESDDEEAEDEDEEDEEEEVDVAEADLDSDHALLLMQAALLLHSTSSAVGYSLSLLSESWCLLAFGL